MRADAGPWRRAAAPAAASLSLGLRRFASVATSDTGGAISIVSFSVTVFSVVLFSVVILSEVIFSEVILAGVSGSAEGIAQISAADSNAAVPGLVMLRGAFWFARSNAADESFPYHPTQPRYGREDDTL
jgi:hypothetical protein